MKTKQELLKLQEEYEKGLIDIAEITGDDLVALDELYDEQINLLDELIAINKEKIRSNIDKIKKLNNS